MKKIIFVLPLMAISLLASCNNNNELPSYYTRRDFYQQGVHDSYELYEYNSKHLVSKITKYHYLRSDPQKFDGITEYTFKYNPLDQLTKKVTKQNEIDESTGQMALFRIETEEHKYDGNHNETEKKTTTIKYIRDPSTFIHTNFIDIEYDGHKNITKKVSKHYTKLNDEPEELNSVVQYTATYDTKNCVLNEIDWDSKIEGDSYTFYKENEKTMTYESKYQDFKTMVETVYEDYGEAIDHSIKYENQFDDKGRISNQLMFDLTPEPELENEENETYIDIEYAYDPNNNIIRRSGNAYEVTESETKVSLALEEHYAYLNYNPNKPIYSIKSGFNKMFSGDTEINKYEYDQRGRIIFSEEMKFSGDVKKPKTHVVYTYQYN